MTRARGVADYGYYPPVNNNILINPSFTVFQRAGTTASGGWGVDHAVDGYGPDRWYLRGVGNVGGGKLESSTEVDAATGINKLLVKHSSAGSHAYVEQFIEAVNIQGLYGKEMTLSFSYSDVGGSGIPKVFIRSWDALATLKSLYEAVPTSLGDNRWTCTVTLSTADGTVPNPNEIGMDVVIFPNEQNNAPDEWSVWETKLEVGSVVTPFIARQYGEELALCQRYFKNGSLTMCFPGVGGRYGYNNLDSQQYRAAPSCTIGFVGNSTNTIRGIGVTNPIGLTYNIYVQTEINSVLDGVVNWTADAEL